jgi:putative resolvase
VYGRSSECAGGVNLTEWAGSQGVHPQTAYRWFREGVLPVPAVRVNSRSVLVSPDVLAGAWAAAFGLYARVSWHDQKSDLDRQVARLSRWAAEAGGQVVRVEAEVGSGVNGSRSKVRPLLADPKVTVVVVEHRDRFGGDEHRTGRGRAVGAWSAAGGARFRRGHR